MNSNGVVVGVGYSGNIFELPYTSENIELQKNVIRSNSIRKDRMVERTFVTEYSATASVDFEFKPHVFDFLLESALASSTDLTETSPISVGNNERKITLYKNYTDLNEGVVFSNSVVDTLSFDISYGNVVGGNATFISTGYSLGNTLQAIPAKEEVPPYTANHFGRLEVEGSDIGVCISGMSFTINNNYQTRGKLGSSLVDNAFIGNFEVSGTLSAYLTPETYQLYLDSINGDKQFQIRFWIGDENATYEFYIPNSDLTILTPVSGGMDQDVLVDIEFYGMYSPVLDNALIINKYLNTSLIDIAMNSLWPEL